MQVFFQTFVNGLTTGCVYALIALGYTMVYGILKLLNFAHGDVYMVGAYIGFVVLEIFGGPNNLSIPVVVLLFFMFVAASVGCGYLGVAMERFAYRPLRNAPRIAPLITALGISFVLENSILLLFGGFVRSYNTNAYIPFSTGIQIGGVQDRHRPDPDDRRQCRDDVRTLVDSSIARRSANRCAPSPPIARRPRCSASTSTARSR